MFPTLRNSSRGAAAFPARARAAAGSLALALTLSACGSGVGALSAGDQKPYTTLRYDHQHPIAVEEEQVTLSVATGPALPSSDQRALEAMAADYRRRGEGPIYVMRPASGAGGLTVNLVGRALRHAGVAGHAIRHTELGAAQGDAAVVVGFAATRAVAPECPTYFGDSTLFFGNETPAHFGCAHQRNLAAMIADPRDLQGPRAATPALSDRRRHVIHAYGAGEATASEKNFEPTSTQDD